MNKTLIKTGILATAAALAVSGQVWAHHPSADMNPNFDFVDEQVSDMHNEVIDAMLEDGDLMMRSSQSMDGSSTQVQEVGGATASAQARSTSGPGAGANRR